MCQFSPENDLPTHKNLKFWSLVTSYFLLTPNIYKTFDNNRNKEKANNSPTKPKKNILSNTG